MGSNTALILVDFETEWTDKNSDYYVGDLSKLIDNTNKLIKKSRTLGHKIIFIQHVEKDSKKEFAPKSKNIEIIKGLDKNFTDKIVTKYKISPFYNTSLEKELKGITHVIVAGILTNLCVRSTVQDAYDREFEVTVVKDCCVALDKETHEFTLKDLKATREEIKLINVSQLRQ